MNFTEISYLLVKIFLLLFMFCFNTINLFLLIFAFYKVRNHLRKHLVFDSDFVYKSPYTPSISILVAAWNEEKTIIESLRSLMDLNYPHYEIVVVSDGSTDHTLEKLQEHFKFERRNIGYQPAIGTARLRGTYDTDIELPPSLFRFVVVDKENGGKADAVNSGINAAQGDFICTIDADCILDRETLLQVVAPIVEDREHVVACGGQVGIVNGCTVINGRVTKTRLPKKVLPLFQVVEYMRAFTAGRTAFELMNSLLILSGAFAVIQRRILIEIGGLMTPYINDRIAIEYCGKEPFTICEDMEVIVRIWRYVYDKGEKKRIAYVPRPICWTEAPESLSDLGSQRARWYRGLLEILKYHRTMIFNPRYGRIGLFSLPYNLVFEAVGPLIEFLGYASLPFLWIVGFLDINYVITFFLVTTAYGTALSIIGVLMGLWQENAEFSSRDSVALFRYRSIGDKLLLALCAALLNLGYRQIILFYQVQGFIGFLRGDRKWKKLARIGFSSCDGTVL